ncbi:hypothetical protein ElyMa_005163700 [Elysia marginata]|uniref:Secreted protein n=1 Tax=Elysia marginata TaxID=1093978 RepID=A0AAV4JPI9_9GAST|nr:hypothetical protein ElyMa_005163700 [Elysia marginata]
MIKHLKGLVLLSHLPSFCKSGRGSTPSKPANGGIRVAKDLTEGSCSGRPLINPVFFRELLVPCFVRILVASCGSHHPLSGLTHSSVPIAQAQHRREQER